MRMSVPPGCCIYCSIRNTPIALVHVESADRPDRDTTTEVSHINFNPSGIPAICHLLLCIYKLEERPHPRTRLINQGIGAGDPSG